jgi:hypothetical protein
MAYERFIKLDDEKHDRIIKSLIGMGRRKFNILLAAFAEDNNQMPIINCTKVQVSSHTITIWYKIALKIIDMHNEYDRKLFF